MGILDSLSFGIAIEIKINDTGGQLILPDLYGAFLAEYSRYTKFASYMLD